MASSSSSAAAARGDSSNRHAAGEELRLVNNKLEEVDRQIEALEEERHGLLARRKALQDIISAPLRDVIDWSRRSFPWSAEVNRVKKDLFHIQDDWRPCQLEVINAILSGRDVFVIMPTGGGKSLTYQLPAYLPASEGKITVVISPLISLISDQIYQLDDVQPGCAKSLTGSQSREEGNAVLREMKDPNSSLQLVYVTPEKIIKSKLFMSQLEKLSEASRLARFVIDEAHCCSTWGFDYRADYAKLGVLRKLFPTVPILCVTATATPQIVRDVDGILGLRDRELFRSTHNRPNLVYEVTEKPASLNEACAEIFNFILQTYPTSSGIVYCYSQKESETVSAKLQELGISTGVYHAGIDAQVKEQVLRRWTNNTLQVVVSTIAFGMGINKPDVRYVIHFSLSKSLEAYYQESGRAGRDGLQASCRLMYRASDAVRQATLVMYERTGSEKLRQIVAYAQTNQTCRRVLMATALGESVNEVKRACEAEAPCDVCAGRVASRQVDLSEAAKAILSIIRAHSAKEKRITHKALADAWLKVNKKHRYLTDREEVERMINQLIVEGVVAEDYHATAYSVNSYCVVGHRGGPLERGEVQVMIEIKDDDAEIAGGGAARGGDGGGSSSSSSASSAKQASQKKVRTKPSSSNGKRQPAEEEMEVVEILSSDSEEEGDREGASGVKGWMEEEEEEEEEGVNGVVLLDDDEEEVNGGLGGGGKEGKDKKRRRKLVEEDDDDDEGDEFCFD